MLFLLLVVQRLKAVLGLAARSPFGPDVVLLFLKLLQPGFRCCERLPCLLTTGLQLPQFAEIGLALRGLGDKCIQLLARLANALFLLLARRNGRLKGLLYTISFIMPQI